MFEHVLLSKDAIDCIQHENENPKMLLNFTHTLS